MSIRIRASAVLIQNNKLLLVNHQKEHMSYWLLPGGGVEHTETLHQALIREIQEEVSLDIKPQDLLFVCESISPGGRHVLHLVFNCRVEGGRLTVNTDERLKDGRFFNEEQLSKLTIYPEIKNLLIEILQKGGEVERPRYLGNLWH